MKKLIVLIIFSGLGLSAQTANEAAADNPQGAPAKTTTAKVRKHKRHNRRKAKKQAHHRAARQNHSKPA